MLYILPQNKSREAFQAPHATSHKRFDSVAGQTTMKPRIGFPFALRLFFAQVW